MYPSNKTIWFLYWNYKIRNRTEAGQVMFLVCRTLDCCFHFVFRKTDELSSSDVFICRLMGNYSSSGGKGVSVNIRNVSSSL